MKLSVPTIFPSRDNPFVIRIHRPSNPQAEDPQSECSYELEMLKATKHRFEAVFIIEGQKVRLNK